MQPMTDDTLTAGIEKILRTKFPKQAGAFLDGADFKSAGIDSIGVVEFLVQLEGQFELPMLDGNELTATSTLGDARALVTARTQS